MQKMECKKVGKYQFDVRVSRLQSTEHFTQTDLSFFYVKFSLFP